MNKTGQRLKSTHPIEVLNKIGVKTSAQRVAILRYLIDNDSHPTAEIIYQDLAPSTPGLSKTTVYNSLKLFAEKGLVSELAIDGREQRYELADPSHSHFRCTSCGRVFDIPIRPEPRFRNFVPAGFHAESYHLHVTGTCPDCTGKGER